MKYAVCQHCVDSAVLCRDTGCARGGASPVPCIYLRVATLPLWPCLTLTTTATA
jgi:hypothetical protein